MSYDVDWAVGWLVLAFDDATARARGPEGPSGHATDSEPQSHVQAAYAYQGP